MESYKLIKSNGDELNFDNGRYYLRSTGAFGNPPIKYSTQETYYADGEYVTNFNATPRALTLSLFAKLGEHENKRTDYWDLRLEILRFLNPSAGSLTFQFTNDNHEIYELTNVYPTNGLSLGSNTYNEGRNDGTIVEDIQLTAYDPIWRKSPIVTTGSIVPDVDTSLIFPITFPITFGTSGVAITQNLTYNGTWRSYPKITLKGPYTTCLIENAATGSSIFLIEPILSSEYRIIDLTNPVSGFTVEDLNGNNKFSEVNIGSNFTNFYLEPEVDNNITITFLSGNDTDTRATIQYYERYLGI